MLPWPTLTQGTWTRQLDRARSWQRKGGLLELAAEPPRRDVFNWYLSQHHQHLFAHLGRYFLGADELGAPDSLLLYCWVHGYHALLGRCGVEVAELTAGVPVHVEGGEHR